MQSSLEGYHQRGIAVAAVGQGSGEEAGRFCARFGATLPCVGDPERRSYRTLGLTRGGFWKVMGRGLLTRPVDSLQKIASADYEGARLASSDVWQLGGVALFDAAGRLRRLHVADDPSDIPPSDEIWQEMAALRD